METLLRIFGYVMGHLRSKLVLDTAYRDWTHLDWHLADRKEFYPDAADDSAWNSGALVITPVTSRTLPSQSRRFTSATIPSLITNVVRNYGRGGACCA